MVARAECEYLKPIFDEDTIIVSLRVPKIGRSSFELEYRLHDGGDTTYATARTTMVCFDSIKRVTVPVPESIKSLV